MAQTAGFRKDRVVKPSDRLFTTILYICMTLVMFITVYPMWYSVINSLNTASDLAKNGYAYLLPREFTLDSWISVVKDPEIVRAFMITFSRTVIVTFFQTLITAMFAYGFSRSYLRGRRLYSSIGFLSMYLSGGVIAYFILFNALKLYNTYWVYIIPCLFGGFYNVIIFNANYKSIPDTLFESAKIDGASEYRIFFQIVLPMLGSSLAALGIFAFLEAWNAYVWPLIVVNSDALFTMELGLSQFQSAFTLNIPLVTAGSLISILPILIVYIVLRRQIMDSFATTGLKG